MKYIIYNIETGKELDQEYFSSQEAWEEIEYGLPDGNYNVIRKIICKAQTCDSEGYERYDAHGISTGHWCDECYDSVGYPYRKDKYPTIEFNGYGERLYNDY